MKQEGGEASDCDPMAIVGDTMIRREGASGTMSATGGRDYDRGPRIQVGGVRLGLCFSAH